MLARTETPRVLAEARTYDELHSALRNRADQLQVSRAELDYLTGLQSGYCGKLLSKTRIKNIGAQSLGPLLCVLGLCLQVVEDPAAMARIGPRLTKRHAASVRYASGRRRKKRPKLGPEWGKLMAARRVLSQSPSERSQIAKRAAVIRWSVVKQVMRAAAKPTRPQSKRNAPPRPKTEMDHRAELRVEPRAY
jgi:hypothetical protein